MPKHHTTESKAQVIALRQSGLRWNAIASQFEMPRSTIRSIYRTVMKTNSFKHKTSSGRPEKTNQREERRIIRLAVKNRTASLQATTVDINIGHNKSITD